MNLFVKICFLLTFFIANLAEAQKSEISFSHLSTADGLSQNNVFTIVQDYKGFMWFGTEDGLNKYDGNQLTIYRNAALDSTSITHNYIKTIVEDSDQNLWIGTFGGGLNLYDRNKDSFIIFKNKYEDPNSLINNNVQVIFEDKKGDIWIGTPSGLNKYNKKDKSFTRFLHDPANPESISDDRIVSIYEDQKENLWIGTMNGLNLFDRKTGKSKKYFHQRDNKNSLSHNYISKIKGDNKGNLWLGTNGGGLNLFNPVNETFTHFRHKPNDPTSLGKDVVFEIYIDRKGALWIGTENGGLNLFHPKTGTFTQFLPDLADASSISNSSVNSVYEDNSGTLWVGVYRGGVNYFNPVQKKFQLYAVNQFKNSINNNTIKAIFEDKKGDIWFGTDGGGLNHFNRKNNLFTEYTPDQTDNKFFNSYSAHCIEEDKNGDLWVGTYGAGLNRLSRDNKKITNYQHIPEDPNSLSSNNITSLLEDKNGSIWIGTSGGGINRFDSKTNQFTRVNCGQEGKDGIASCWINSIFEDSKGNIWIAASWGLSLYDKVSKVFTHFHTLENTLGSSGGNISSEDVYTIFEDRKGGLWIGTKNGLNLFDYNTKSFKVYKTSDGLPSNTITSIEEDNHGNLWLGTFHGLSKFNPETLSIQNFEVSEGLQGNEFINNSSLKTKNGELLFGGTGGYNLFHPDSLKGNTYSPPVYLTSFSIFNKPVKAGENAFLDQNINEEKEITLSYIESVFSFEFAALNYINSEKNQYAYKMEGFDRDWNYVGTEKKATYTNLDPGDYTFRVKASNNDGVWNEEGTALSLIISPPYWKTWWFRTLLGLSLVGGAFTFYQVRMNAVKEQKAELERQVQEKTADIQQANNDLTERQEEILQQQEELQAQAEILQQTNENLRETQEEIAIQRDHLQIVNEQVMSSIQYARTIQKAILPSNQKITQVFPEYFILYRPKDVVSGDFYWFTHLLKEDSGLESDLTFMAVVDCTGHGVPGAFMSIIGSTILNEIINQKKITDPAQILEHLHQGVKQAVEKSEGVNTAGMDVCLCRFEKAERQQEVKILFSGAKRNLLYVEAGKSNIDKLHADRRSIGSDSSTPFTTQELILNSGSMLYLTSDGYADQNNVARDKLGTKKLHQLISQGYSLPIHEQKLLLESALDTHQQGTEQRDDITLIGIKL